MRRDATRGQTEPLAALLAVAMIAIGVGIYGVYVTDLLPGASQGTVDDAAIHRIWSEIQDDGAYRSTDNPWDDVGGDDRYDTVDSPVDDLPPKALPRGKTVCVAISVVDENGRESTLERACYDERAQQVSPPDELPARARTATRPLPVAVRPGDVWGGTLRVSVW